MLKLTENEKMRETSGSHEGDAPFFFFFFPGKYVVLTQWMSCSLQEQMRFFTHYRQSGSHFTTVCSHLQRHNVPLTLNIPEVLLRRGKRLCACGVFCACVCCVFFQSNARKLTRLMKLRNRHLSAVFTPLPVM